MQDFARDGEYLLCIHQNRPWEVLRERLGVNIGVVGPIWEVPTSAKTAQNPPKVCQILSR